MVSSNADQPQPSEAQGMSLQPEASNENQQAEPAEDIEYFDPADGQDEIEIQLPE